MIDIALADKFLNSDLMDLDCAAKSVNLNKEKILADLGANRLEAQIINGTLIVKTFLFIIILTTVLLRILNK